jgi:hypothetical protein
MAPKTGRYYNEASGRWYRFSDDGRYFVFEDGERVRVPQRRPSESDAGASPPIVGSPWVLISLYHTSFHTDFGIVVHKQTRLTHPCTLYLFQATRAPQRLNLLSAVHGLAKTAPRAFSQIGKSGLHRYYHSQTRQQRAHTILNSSEAMEPPSLGWDHPVALLLQVAGLELEV